MLHCRFRNAHAGMLYMCTCGYAVHVHMCMRNESYKVVHDMLGGAICSCDNDECLSAHAHGMLQVMQGVPTLLALEWGCVHVLHHSVGAHA